MFMDIDIQNELPEGFDIQIFSFIDSTNMEAARKIELGSKGGLWIKADEQSNGRGRGDRLWISKPGNLYASLIYEINENIRDAAQLSFITALAVRDTIVKCIPNKNIKCKWPNDILVSGKKISGILLESRLNKIEGIIYIIIGTGINIDHHPELTSYEATHINEQTKQKRSHSEVFVMLAEKMDYWLSVWKEKGFDPIRESWLGSAIGIGEKITVKTMSNQLIGWFVGLDRDGALMLEVDGNIKIIHSGDVFLETKEREL